MLRKSLFSAVIITAFLIFATASTDTCVGDESCRSTVEHTTRKMYEPTIRYVGDGTFHVSWITSYGERKLTSYETDCNCNLTYINGRKQD